MQVTLLAVGRRMPAWVQAAGDDYRKRLPRHWQFAIREIAQASGGAPGEIMAREADALLKPVTDKQHVVALDNRGVSHSTESLADELQRWQGLGKDLLFMIGGADGLDPRCHERADQLWSLSPLTFPHPLVRVILLEQLYRAHTLLIGHPYHRG